MFVDFELLCGELFWVCGLFVCSTRFAVLVAFGVCGFPVVWFALWDFLLFGSVVLNLGFPAVLGCAVASLFLDLGVGFAWFELAYECGFSCGVW